MKTKIVSALISGLLMAILVVLIEIVNAKTIYSLDWKTIISDGVIALLTAIVSLIKSLLTTSNGNFIGAVKVK